ncbi:hypothetical protein NOR_05435 [Metarhizium rileyi]|uniref:Uncharacterized protein n=1 Tax=Metarhizium rileyi (strain RCEF 4871) TaxID=1649241 RepID=A0A167CMF1_METRR|nr:hypothetical protein NOR_05435 [Metarhizium rileyi RCEF 4871]
MSFLLLTRRKDVVVRKRPTTVKVVVEACVQLSTRRMTENHTHVKQSDDGSRQAWREGAIGQTDRRPGSVRRRRSAPRIKTELVPYWSAHEAANCCLSTARDGWDLKGLNTCRPASAQERPQEEKALVLDRHDNRTRKPPFRLHPQHKTPHAPPEPAHDTTRQMTQAIRPPGQGPTLQSSRHGITPRHFASPARKPAGVFVMNPQ